jgi:hypothetical protein
MGIVAGFGIVTILLLGLNFGLSWWNAYSAGKIWTEVKQIGGFPRVLAVSAFVMSVAGFTLVYSIILLVVMAFIAPTLGWLSESDVQTLLQLIGDMSYVLVITAVIPSGFIIWINSLIRFWKQKSLKHGGIAAWNTFAMASNVISAARHMPSAISRIVESSKNAKGGVVLLALVVVACAVLGGYFTAHAILKKADKKYDLFQYTNPNYAVK